jgi:hypothetical protein
MKASVSVPLHIPLLDSVAGEDHGRRIFVRISMDTQTTGRGPSYPNDTIENQKNKQNTFKRGRVESDSDSDDNINNTTWPRFLLIQSSDDQKPLRKLSPFAVLKGIEGLAGTPDEVQRLRSGDILVKVSRRCHSDNLLRSSVLVDIPITVSSHRTLNSSKGVIRSRDFIDCPEEEMLLHLRKEGVTHVKRISIKRNGEVKNTGTLILTFGSPVLPTCVKCAYLNITVDPYIPNPLRCFKCQRFGHHRQNCKRSSACARCGADHDDASCNAAHHCINCDGDHTAFSRDCPMWIKEKAIQSLKVSKCISFPEARKFVEDRDAIPKVPTYARVVGAQLATSQKPTDHVSLFSVSRPTQTDLTWPNGLSTPQPTPIGPSNPPSTKRNISVQTTSNFTIGQSHSTPNTSKSKNIKHTKEQQKSSDSVNRNRIVHPENMDSEESSCKPVPDTSQFTKIVTVEIHKSPKPVPVPSDAAVATNTAVSTVGSKPKSTPIPKPQTAKNSGSKSKKKDKPAIVSDRAPQGSRFNHLSNEVLELALHVEECGLDAMDDILETPPNNNQSSVR